MEIPYEKLNPDTLKRLLEYFVLREGTDYGVSEPSLEQKIEEVQKQLKERKAKIVFDGPSGSYNIVPIL